jgi:hypothetical protein
MSLFDLPRINVAGNITLNPATANNDDYAANLTLPENWGPFAGAPLALVDSQFVEARTYGMSDADFIAWVQQPQTFNNNPPPPATMSQVPAEWNYYGDLSSDATGTVTGVQGAAQSLVGATLTFTGGICDVNTQGSPPATQFFIDQLTLTSGSTVVIQGRPSKGACQWLNFYRNVNLQADGGAGGYIYHVLLKDAPGTIINVPELQDPSITGVIIRYYLFCVIIGDNPLPQPNPAALQFVATIAPLYASETIFTGPTGRLLVANDATIQTPAGTTNNGNNGKIALAPAVLQQNGNTISADFAGTFPDYYQNGANPKFDFGTVTLSAVSGETITPIGPVNYLDLDGGNAAGWIFDFDVSGNAAAQTALQDPNVTFCLVHPTLGNVLGETDYYFVSNQQGIYAEQYGAGDAFLNQGSVEPATVAVYRRGQLLPAGECPPITIWQYRSIPLEAPGDAEVLTANFSPGDPISVDTSQPGNYLFTFTIDGTGNPPPEGYPPKSYLTFQNPPYITNAPSISLRILPNNEDFSMYYVDPSSEEPVGNDQLTFDVVYAKVLRTYYLLFPVMSQIFALNDEQAVAAHAKGIIARTEMALWMTTQYMPRTRDMSETRRRLLRAWRWKVLQG